MVDDKFATIVEETEVHEFDPHGDVVLILHRRTFSEASDEGASDGHQDNADADGPIEETTPVAESPAEEEAPADEAPPPEEVALALEGSAAGSDDVVAQAALLEYYSSTKLKEKKNLSPRSKEPKFMEHVQHVRLRVSSKHLILTSQMFKAELLGGFKEAEILRNEQFLEKSLPDDDADAWIILLNILHHRNRKVPRTVDLETLTQVACLVDKYFLHEAVEVFANLWISDLLPEIPNVFWRDAVTWICISGVFKEQETYKKMTKLAQLESKGKIDTRELPFPSDAIGKLYITSIKCPFWLTSFQKRSIRVDGCRSPRSYRCCWRVVKSFSQTKTFASMDAMRKSWGYSQRSFGN